MDATRVWPVCERRIRNVLILILGLTSHLGTPQLGNLLGEEGRPGGCGKRFPEMHFGPEMHLYLHERFGVCRRLDTEVGQILKTNIYQDPLRLSRDAVAAKLYKAIVHVKIQFVTVAFLPFPI